MNQKFINFVDISLIKKLSHMLSLLQWPLHISVILQVPEEMNILTDGCLIDLCGVTLIWRTAMGLEQAPVCDMWFVRCIHTVCYYRVRN